MSIRRSIPASSHARPWRARTIGWPCLVFAALLTAACARSQHPPGHPAAHTTNTASTGTVPEVTSAGTASGEHLGTVHVIGTGRRFVLIETPSTQPVSTLADGQALVCRASGAVTATLHASHERRPPFVVADVVSGEPHIGDEVFIDTAPGRAVIPTPASGVPSPPPNPQSPPATPEFHTNPALPPAR